MGKDAGAGAEVVSAVERDPGLDGLQIFKEDGAVNLEIAHERELAERLDADGLLEVFDERGAGHAGFAVDAHGAGTADLFETIRVVGDGRGGAAVGCDGIGGDLHHGGDDVHAGTPFEFEVLPHSGCIGAGLALDFELYGLRCHESVSLELFHCVVAARARFDVLDVDVFIFEARACDVAGVSGLGGLEKLFVVAVGEVGLVVRAA